MNYSTQKIDIIIIIMDANGIVKKIDRDINLQILKYNSIINIVLIIYII